MQLLPLDTSDGLSVGTPVSPLQFRDLSVNGSAAQESDLEDLLVANPSLLNTSAPYRVGAAPELLFISRQPRTATRKRFDLLAVDRDGSVVLVEVKRDASDERARREAMEFQAIRYAAACRTMTAGGVVELYASYLRDTADPVLEANDGYWADKALSAILNHVESETASDDLDDLIDPRSQLRIMLVAADYEEDMLSACAWLLEKEIDITCVRLRPYRIADKLYLEREQLIPPPALDDFFVTMAFPGARAPAKSAAQRRMHDRAELIEWVGEDGLDAGSTPVSSWREALTVTLNRVASEVDAEAMRNGLSIRSALDDDGTDQAGMRVPHQPDGCPVVFELHGSAAGIRKYLSELVSLSPTLAQARVTTRAKHAYLLPQ